MIRFKRLTIRTKIILLSLPLVLGALVVSGYFYYRVSSSSIIIQTEIETGNLINQLSNRINERFDRASSDVRAISQLPSLPNYYFNEEYGLEKEAETFRLELENFMLNVARRANDYATVRFIEADGREAKCSTAPG